MDAGSLLLADAATHCERALTSVGLRAVARIREASFFDLAFRGLLHQSIVVRCTPMVEASDYSALQSMLAERDFDRAVLVYCDAEQPDLSDEIESWPIGDIEKLAASLSHGGASS